MNEPQGPVPQPTNLGLFPGTTEILLIRHGRSADVVPGTPESKDPGLHEIGRGQAQALADRLATKRIDAVYASHLARAIETAQPLADARGLTVNVVEDLQEVLLGDWGEGEFRRRAAIGDPEFLAAMATGRWDAIPGAERDEDLRARVTTTVLGFGTAHVDQTVAVVSHGGAINACLAGLLEIDRSHIAAIENTSITTVHLREGAPARLITMNDCSHIYDPVLGHPD
jgi:2,3-bisphosphoglycerate-dependent phosphoglycerate mutase